MKCRGVLFVGGGKEEYADWEFQVHAVCDDLGKRDCGFTEHLTEHDGDIGWFITSEEFDAIQRRHRSHSQKVWVEA